ncbi:hypothetical protein AZZ62_005008, partial [Klebsiella variicola]
MARIRGPFSYLRHARRIKPAELFGVSLWN